MWDRPGGRSVPLESMEWLRVLRPATFALSTVGDRIPSVKFARPVCSVIDRLANRVTNNPFRFTAQATTRSVDVDLNDDLLVKYLLEFASAYSLRPVWDTRNLKWLLSRAAENRRHGAPVGRAVYGRGAAPLGCYLYYTRPHGVARVLQVMASSKAVGAVLDDLFMHANQNRCAAVRGRTHSRHMNALFQRECIFSIAVRSLCTHATPTWSGPLARAKL